MMLNEKFNLVEKIESIESSLREVYGYVSLTSSLIDTVLNEFNRDYKVCTDWSIDLVEDPMLVSVSIFIDVTGRKAFVDKIYTEDLSRPLDRDALIAKCDETYQTYFVK